MRYEPGRENGEDYYLELSELNIQQQQEQRQYLRFAHATGACDAFSVHIPQHHNRLAPLLLARVYTHVLSVIESSKNNWPGILHRFQTSVGFIQKIQVSFLSVSFCYNGVHPQGSRIFLLATFCGQFCWKVAFYLPHASSQFGLVFITGIAVFTSI